MIRRELRLAELTTKPTEKRTMLNGLDLELCDIKQKAVENYTKYKEKFAETGKYRNGVKLIPVFVTKEQREEYCKIENKTKAEILKLVLTLCNTMPDKTVGDRIAAEIGKKSKQDDKAEPY